MLRSRPVFYHLGRAAAAYAVLLIALILTVLAFYYVRWNVEASERVRFEEAVTAVQEAIDRRMSSYVDAMLGARGLFYASESVEREEWRGYVEGIALDSRYEGIQAMGYVSYVTPEEKDAFEDQLEGAYAEEDLQKRPAVRPSGERSEYFPTTYIEPFDRANSRLLGEDRYLEPVHRAAMDRARDTGRPQATGKVFAFFEASQGSTADLALKPGLVVYLPIYEKDEPTGTVDERRSALDGFLACYLAADELLRGIFEEPYEPSIDFELYDGGGLTPTNLLYDDDGIMRAGRAQEPPSGASDGASGLPVDEAEVGSSDLSRFRRLEIVGREWDVYFEALPEFRVEGESRLPLFVLLSGLAVSLLLFATTLMLIRSRVRAERTSRDLEEANRELESTNRELEAFSYSVSHDLRAPLRSMDGFSQILLEDYADDLDEEGKDYLDRVRAASQRMGHLIDDLLGLSRVARGSLNRERVNLSSLVEEVAEGMREVGSGRKVEFSVQKGLEVWGDPQLLRVALENLIGNAWKFTQREPEGKIEFGLDEELSRRGRVPVYYVSDNGAGFDMSYADKLFGAFQRLHAAEEFEGTGIGLATVQRVVRRHGGRVWAEGEVGRGATFYFTLRPGLRHEPEALREEVEAR